LAEEAVAGEEEDEYRQMDSPIRPVYEQGQS
jgi:hypothetical protein